MEDSIITIASYPYSRAQLLKVMLESEGIECFLSNINLVQPDIATGVDIRINKSDMNQAINIIDNIKSNYGIGKQKTIEKLKNVRRILVPVDFSEYSINACKYAVGLAVKLKAEIKLFYSFFNPVISSEPYLETYTYQINIDSVLLNLEGESKSQMKKLVGQLKALAIKEGSPKLKISYVLEKGIPEDVILHYAESYKPGVIILGTKGSGESKINLIGGVTKKIIEGAKVPVICIPEYSKYTGMGYLNKVLYATNFDDSELKSIRKLMMLVRPFDMKIYITHISSDTHNDYDNTKMESLKQHFSKNYRDYNVTFNIIGHTDVHIALEQYIDEKDIDVLALTTHKRGIFEKLFNPSLTKKMLFHSNIPLLVFHSSMVG